MSPPIGFVYDPLYLEHDTGSHPENAQRLTATMLLLEASGLLEQLTWIDARDATPDEVARVHDALYVDAVREIAARGGAWADPDTLITPRSYDVALRATGGVLAGLDAVMAGEVASAFCLLRPPGHHARPRQAMGFCIFNHVAVAAAAARGAHGLERVAIVDFDVHHGNGTQDAFYDDASVLYVSTHEYPFYPGTGAASETGAAEGRGYNINIPMPDGCGDNAYRRAYAEVVVPALDRFRPQLILVSAGYDGHFADPLAGESMSVDGFGELVSMITASAERLCDGRLVFALEGGYDLVALPWCVRRTLEVLTGVAPTLDPLGTFDAATPAAFDARLEEVKRLHGL